MRNATPRSSTFVMPRQSAMSSPSAEPSASAATWGASGPAPVQRPVVNQDPRCPPQRHAIRALVGSRLHPCIPRRRRLLHRHFGSKAELVTAAIEHFRAQTRAKVDAVVRAPDFADELINIFRDDASVYPRLRAWSLLDGVEPENLQGSYPSVVAIVARLESAGFDPALARREPP